MSTGLLSRLADRVSEAKPDPRVIWRRLARPEQLMPAGTWRVWFIRGGRGSGKTRSGAGGLAEIVLEDTDGEGEYGIIAPTYADAWTKCVEGEAGILRALGTSMKEVKDHSSKTVKSAWRTYGQVVMHNGIIIYVDSAAEGGLRIQGRNLKAAWADEIGLWDKWQIAWKESLWYAVRKGRACIIATGTPKASRPARKLVRSLLRNDPEHGGVVNTRLRTIDNVANLAAAFAASVIGMAKGTRLERQELDGDLLDDVANSLWTRDHLDSIHCPGVGEPGGPPYLTRVHIGVDPSDGSEDSDEQAYTVVGRGDAEDPHLYVAECWGGQESPVPFAKRVLRRAVELDATVVVEKNHGGEWLRSVFVLVMKEMGVKARIQVVHASQAKRTRAEPVAAMYDRGGGTMVQHCHRTTVTPCDCEDHAHPDGHIILDEHMPELEDQMATFTGAAGERSPDRLDSLVWGVSKFLTMTMGPPVAGGRRDWAAAKTLEELNASPADRLRKRLERGNPALTGHRWDLDDFAPRDGDEDVVTPVRAPTLEWGPDTFAPADGDTGAQRANVHSWH